jgi:hypothetical protein
VSLLVVAVVLAAANAPLEQARVELDNLRYDEAATALKAAPCHRLCGVDLAGDGTRFPLPNGAGVCD